MPPKPSSKMSSSKGGKSPALAPGGKAKKSASSSSSSPKSKNSSGGSSPKKSGGSSKGGGSKSPSGSRSPSGSKSPSKGKSKQGGAPGKGGGGAQVKNAKSPKGGKGRDSPDSRSVKGQKAKPKMARQGTGKRKGFFGKIFGRIAAQFGGGEKIILASPEAREAAEALGLTNANLSLLKDKYENIDLDGSGEIDQDEFFDAVGEQRSPFTDGLFRLIDADGSGTVEFDEYVMVLSTYCMYTKEDILKFCFDLFDVDGSNTIDEKEFVELVKCVNNASPMFPGNFGQAITMFDVNDDGLIDFNEFVEIDKRFPLVLYPAFKLQDKMQRLTLGEKEWRSINEAVTRCKRDMEYREKHNGRPMPEGFVRGLMKKSMPCCVDTRVVDVEKIEASRPAAVLRAMEAAKGPSSE